LDNRSSILGKANDEIFSLLHHAQARSGAHPASYTTYNGGSFPGGKADGDVKLTTRLLVPRLRRRGAIPPPPQCVFMAWCLVKHRDYNFTFHLSIFMYYGNVSSKALLTRKKKFRERHLREKYLYDMIPLRSGHVVT
jgi:hypothetical protein